ncbi:FAD1 [Candida oxycetoniae]|uniref:FAD synthase n=1 Tax=Candida oxycetoniae TaxID=497107 RepID=A0AAI9SWY2_9ASCO|nr:FAD1 [Candida oxycetoniae]KAI3404070.1 FAD1 [Candida oxycetoniae]
MSVEQYQKEEEGQKQQQQQFFKRCQECYNLIVQFQNDTLPSGLVPSRHEGYQYDPELRKSVKAKIQLSMQRLDESISHHGLKEIAISYNGGKDCLVMLILLMATIYKKYISTTNEMGSHDIHKIPADYKLDSIYVNSETPFPELAEFINESTEYYHLNPIIIKDSMKHGFEHYLSNINTNIKSVIIGIRFTDPFGENLVKEQYTDHNWPKFLRIHPILDWKYVEIWDFLIGTNVEYCKLYDKGYTSLGGVENTIPNPKLKLPRSEEYLPAYRLRDNADTLERLGRIKKEEWKQSEFHTSSKSTTTH